MNIRNEKGNSKPEIWRSNHAAPSTRSINNSSVSGCCLIDQQVTCKIVQSCLNHIKYNILIFKFMMQFYQWPMRLALVCTYQLSSPVGKHQCFQVQ